jgi:hypothetical protein
VQVWLKYKYQLFLNWYFLFLGCDYQELWRDVIHDWGQFQLSRLFGREVYKFDLLNNSIETHDIRTYDKLSTLQLVEEMRYPHGEIAGLF